MFKVLVTAVGGAGVGEQIIKALRLSNNEYYIIGLDIQEFSKGFSEVDRSYVVPMASSSDYIDIVLSICIKEKIKVVFCGSEAEIKRISPERDRFTEQGILFPYNSQEVLDLCFNKLATVKWLKENGFFAPTTMLVSSIEELMIIDDFPVVLKPHLNSGGSANVFIVQDENELRLFGIYLFSIYNDFIVQQYIGSPYDEYTVGVLFDMEGNLINSIAVRKNILSGLSNKIKIKNRTTKSELGDVLAISSGISQGEIGDFPVITKQCEVIASRMRCVSAINIQCRVFDEKVYVFEINPRFSGTTSLRAMVGYNEPDVLIRKYFYNFESGLYFEYKKGVIFRGLSEVFIQSKEEHPPI